MIRQPHWCGPGVAMGHLPASHPNDMHPEAICRPATRHLSTQHVPQGCTKTEKVRSERYWLFQRTFWLARDLIHVPVQPGVNPVDGRDCLPSTPACSRGGACRCLAGLRLERSASGHCRHTLYWAPSDHSLCE